MDNASQDAQVRSCSGLPGDVFWVERGKLLAGPYPGSQDQDQAEVKISALLDLGIDSFVDLTEENEPSPTGEPLVPYDQVLYGLAHERGLEAKYFRMPIPDLGIPQEWHMEAILKVAAGCLAEGDGVYVHCLGGVGRTGTVLGCRAVSLGTPATEVFDLLAYLRRNTDRADRPAPETAAQRDFVLDWARRSTRNTATTSDEPR